MSDYFDDVEVNDENEFVGPEQELVGLNASHSDRTSPRKRLEQLMEDKRLRDELEDFLDV